MSPYIMMTLGKVLGTFGLLAAGCALMGGCAAAPEEETGAGSSSAVSTNTKFQHQVIVESVAGATNPDDTNADHWSLETVYTPGMPIPSLVAFGRRNGTRTVAVVIAAGLTGDVSVRVATTAKPDASSNFRGSLANELGTLISAAKSGLSWPASNPHDAYHGTGFSCGSPFLTSELAIAGAVVGQTTAYDTCAARTLSEAGAAAFFSIAGELSLCADTTYSVDAISTFVDGGNDSDICGRMRL